MSLRASSCLAVQRGLTPVDGSPGVDGPEVLERPGMLDISPATATARRNLLQRIDRFVAALEQTQRLPASDEAQGVLAALAWLELELYPLGEDAMMRAERGWRPAGREGVTAAAEPEILSAQALRDALARMGGG